MYNYAKGKVCFKMEGQNPNSNAQKNTVKSVITFKPRKNSVFDPSKIVIDDKRIKERKEEIKSMMRAKTVTNEDLQVDYTMPDGLYS